MEVVFEDERVVLEDIYVGILLLLSGQSNMELPLTCTNYPLDTIEKNDALRFFAVHYDPAEDAGFALCEGENIHSFSAVGYVAGKEIAEKTGEKVGLVGCYQGSSVIESWVPRGAFAAVGIDIPIEQKAPNHSHPSCVDFNGDGMLYEGRLARLFPMSFNAVAWYQGEADTSEAEAAVYDRELAALIAAWRTAFLDETLPFTLVQLADYLTCMKERGMGWVWVQTAQTRVAEDVPYVRTVVCRDICENDNIHPRSKTALGHRVAESLMKQI